MYKHIKARFISPTSVQSTKPPSLQDFKISGTDSVIGSANSSDDSVVIGDETVRTPCPPPTSQTCAAPTGLRRDPFHETLLGSNYQELPRQLGSAILHLTCSSHHIPPLGKHVHQLHLTCNEYAQHLSGPRDPRHDAWQHTPIFEHPEGLLWMWVCLRGVNLHNLRGF